MESLLTASNITFVLGVLAIIFTVYNYFRNPQVSLEKSDLLTTGAIANLQKDLTNLRDNHVHSLDVKIEEANKNINSLALQVTRLATIIEERIPKK